ncbi:hypothetical protein EV361DRAFT_809407, partial [Lentinula raphanica]
KRFCQTQSPEEIAELLVPLRERYRELGAPDPEMIVVDNCCAVRAKIHTVFPQTHVVLDVWHCLKRYLNTVNRGTKNPCYKAVAHDITSAILKKRASESPTNIAIYHSQKDQITLLEAAYQKWADKNIWNASGASVHTEQMKHVRNGCLTRTRQDIRSDGSRIENSHKGWNSLQRSFASGLEVMTALGHDLIHRRNMRTGLNCSQHTPESSTLPLEFILSAEGSHHIHLRNKIAITYNSIIKEREISPTAIPFQPELPSTTTPETFGLINSDHAATFGGLFTLKEESDEDEKLLLQDIEPPVEIEEATVDNEIDESVALSKKPKMDEDHAGDSSVNKVHIHHANAHLSGGVAALEQTPLLKAKDSPAIDSLTSPLPIPSKTAPSLTRSQSLFESCSNIHPKSLAIDDTVEFHLFMEMREEFKWVSYAMTPRRWADATREFNSRLKGKNASLLPKLPRALSNKLGDIEKLVGERIASNNFLCKFSLFLSLLHSLKPIRI